MAEMDYNQQGDVAVLTLDDGKANAISPAFVDAVNEGLDRAGDDAKSVLITGRPGMFSGGFDLKEFEKGPDATMALVNKGARMLLRIFSHPQPVVIACSGHAIAAGAFMLLAADTRVGAEGDFKIGLNETAIGMTLPTFGLELAKSRLSKRYQTAAVIQAQLFDPEGARDVGFLDEVVAADSLLDHALQRAVVLARMPNDAYAANKLAIREASIAAIRASLG
ncbi:MAG: crotonase/enoyl-CoA hydratase family protein [Gammaproteobacteria bacterium]|nr:crotonase/enoyl-CoA hydratase family protein [Gammaproteobacteria bacterium]